MKLEPLIISAPFGNWLSYPGCTSTLGTFTLHYRGGLLYRAWRCLCTLRYNRRQQSWINKLGLPNPGLASLSPSQAEGRIVSIHGFNETEWTQLAEMCVALPCVNCIELNLSCPNVGHRPSVGEIGTAVRILERCAFLNVIAKLPPVKWMSYAIPLWDMGVTAFHCCNTIGTPGGGLSGKVLKPYSLWAIEELRARFGASVMIIGGGGVTGVEDVKDYYRAGADHVAVASMFLNPFNWRRVPLLVETAKRCKVGGAPCQNGG